MNFREISYEEDIKEIVSLIRYGLDPNFTEKFFLWKHLHNPFGKSFGLIAEENGEIVGLRMFMFWEFYNIKEERTLKAIRPVDTVVSSNYRGRGLFKKLTLKGIESCMGDFDLIFNTPNDNSLPGYLKMGWNLSVKAPKLKLGFINPFYKRHDLQELNIDSIDFSRNYIKSYSDWSTNKSEEYIKWRYSAEEYKSVKFRNCILIYSVLFIKGIKTILIYEMLGDPEFFQGMIINLMRKNRSLLIYFANNKQFENIKFVATITRKEPKIVFKNDSANIQEIIDFSLGDVEGKL